MFFLYLFSLSNVFCHFRSALGRDGSPLTRLSSWPSTPRSSVKWFTKNTTRSSPSVKTSPAGTQNPQNSSCHKTSRTTTIVQSCQTTALLPILLQKRGFATKNHLFHWFITTEVLNYFTVQMTTFATLTRYWGGEGWTGPSGTQPSLEQSHH